LTPLIFDQFGLWTFNTVGWISLIAALTNAFNGALLARRPSHYKHFSFAGILVMGYAGGIGGGIVRDVLVNKIPSPLENPWYLIGCLAVSTLAIVIALNAAKKFQDGLFQFMTAFSLPWYAIVGAQAALAAHLGYAAAVLIGVLATTAGRWIIDVSCGCVPILLTRGGFTIASAALAAASYLVCDQVFALNVVAATAIAWAIGFGFRIASLMLGWEEWEPWEPAELKAGEKSHEKLGEAIKTEL
jgi:uncharacterized membrane protein YeiH